MAQTTTAPVNVIQGQSTSVVPAQYADAGNAVQQCVVFNQTAFELLVSGQFGQRYLQPLFADIFPCTAIVNAPSVVPVTGLLALANPQYLGTISAMFAYAGDAPFVGYPTPLTQFPGGSALMLMLPVSFPAFNDLPINIVPPSGTGSFTVNYLVKTGTVPTNLFLKGVQTGVVYSDAPFQTTTAGPGGTIASSDLTIFEAFDTEFAIELVPPATGAGTLTVYAAPPSGVPSGPSLVARLSGTNGQLIAVPTTGTSWLYGADFQTSTAGANAELVNSGGGGGAIANLGALGSTADFIDHVDLNGLRAGGQVAVNFSSPTTSGIVLRWAPGP